MNDRTERMARAGDYVLGLMDEDEKRRAERAMEIDPEFRACVALLATRLGALDRSAGTAAVSDAVWTAVEERIAGLPQMRGPLAASPIKATTERQADEIVSARRRRKARRTAAHALGGWRGGLIAASLLVACGVGYLGGRMTAQQAEPTVVVVLVDEANVPGAIVEAYGDDRVRIVPLTDFEVPKGKVLQAWTLWDRSVGPVSLGTFENAAEIRLTGPDDLPAPVEDQLYEITLEDAPGSTAGRPLGPILVKGLAVRPPR